MTGSRSAKVPREAADRFLRKARESREVMDTCLSAGKLHVAGNEAIQTVISSCDAITAYFLGRRSTGQDHFAVLELIEEIRAKGVDNVRRQARDVLELKSLIQYRDEELSEKDARRVCLQAGRVLDWALENLTTTGGQPP